MSDSQSLSYMAHPEVSFARGALAEYWALRTQQPKPESDPASQAHEHPVILGFQKRRCSRRG